MQCGFMISTKGKENLVPCGQCMACRINRKRTVMGQMILEAYEADDTSSFVTLTYNPENYPGDGSLKPEHMRTFVNRLRQKEALGPIRYLYVGEYGSKTQRAHYHMALFGVPPEVAEVACNKRWRVGGESMGFVHTGEITQKSISYIAGYCTKKMGRNDSRLEGRYPEFNRRSRFPPLGAEGIYRIIDALHTRTGSAGLAAKGDVPNQFRTNNRLYPISAYWRKFMRAELGITDPPRYQPWAVDFDGYFKEVDRAKKRQEKLWRQQEQSESRRTI